MKSADTDVPQGTFEGPRFRALRDHLLALGASNLKATEMAQKMCQSVMAGAWRKAEGDFVKRLKAKYEIGEGFDAELKQLYIPRLNLMLGRRGNFYVRDKLKEIGDE